MQKLLSFCWFTNFIIYHYTNSIILLVYHLLNVKFLVFENQVGQCAFINVLQNFPAFLGPHCHRTICQLMMMHHLKGFSSKIIFQHLVHGGFAHTTCCSQCLATLTRVALQLFSHVFNELRGVDTSFSALPFPVKGVASLFKLLNNFPNCLTVHFQPFCNFDISFTTFVKFNNCILIYNHCNTNFRKFLYI